MAITRNVFAKLVVLKENLVFPISSDKQEIFIGRSVFIFQTVFNLMEAPHFLFG